MIGEFYFCENYFIVIGIGFYFNVGGKFFYEEGIDIVSIWIDVNIFGDDIYEGGMDFKYSIQYVEIFIGLKFCMCEFGYFKYYVELCMVFGFCIQVRGNIFNDGFVDSEEDFDIQFFINLLNIFWGLGVGVEYIVFFNIVLVGGIGFQMGFIDVIKDKNIFIVVDGCELEEDLKGKFNSIVFCLGVMFQ